MSTTFYKRMIESAEPEMVDLARKFQIARDGFFGSPQTHTMNQYLGAYARAKRAWSEFSGEPLL